MPLATDPRSIAVATLQVAIDQGSVVRYRYSREPVPLIPGPLASWLLSRIPISPIDQGSVLAVRVFGSLSIYFTPQLEVVPRQLLLWLVSQEPS